MLTTGPQGLLFLEHCYALPQCGPIVTTATDAGSFIHPCGLAWVAESAASDSE